MYKTGVSGMRTGAEVFYEDLSNEGNMSNLLKQKNVCKLKEYLNSKWFLS